MARSLLTLLLLLHYLLVVCVSASIWSERPVSRPFAYVHHHDCQLKNAWRGGVCYEDCNGTQYRAQKGHAPVPLHQLLALLKGVDVHCLAPLPGVVAPPYLGVVEQWRAEREYRVPGGVRGAIYVPPSRG